MTQTPTRSTKVHAFVVAFNTHFFDARAGGAGAGDGAAAGAGAGGGAGAGSVGAAGPAAVPVSFSTCASATPTHWKQTVLVLKEPLDVTPAQDITGSLTMQRDHINHREYHFVLRLRTPQHLVYKYHMS